MKTILGACMMAVVFASCSNEESGMDASKNEFTVITSIDAMSRAPQLNPNGSGSFQKGDQYSLIFSTTDGLEYVHHFDYTHGHSYYWADLQVPVGHSQAKIAAVYPAVTVASTQAATAFKWDVTASNATNDLLLAMPASVEVNKTPSIQLNFGHALHKFIVKLSGDDSFTKGATITCKDFKPVADINLLTGTVAGASGKLESTTVSGTSASFILPAQEVGTMAVVFNVEGKNYTFQLADCKVNGQPLTKLESGMSFELNVTVSKNGFTITGQEISAWGSQGSHSGTIIL